MRLILKSVAYLFPSKYVNLVFLIVDGCMLNTILQRAHCKEKAVSLLIGNKIYPSLDTQQGDNYRGNTHERERRGKRVSTHQLSERAVTDCFMNDFLYCCILAAVAFHSELQKDQTPLWNYFGYFSSSFLLTLYIFRKT